MKVGLVIVAVIIVLGGGWYFYNNQQAVPEEGALPKVGDAMMEDGDSMMEQHDDAMEKEDDAMMEDGDSMMEQKLFNYQGSLSDVAGTNSSGDAKAGYKDGAYTLVATFEGLSEPEGTDFYEGWVVRRGADMSVISTGRVNEEEVGYVNLFTSDTDLTDHDFYVLTLEPDDGDPAPAEHILEGTLSKK